MLFFSFFRWAGLRPLASGLFLLAATSCGADQATPAKGDVLVSTDFENLAGWMGTSPNSSLNREEAHSGPYSIKVDGSTEYSVSFSNTLGNQHDVRVRRVRVRAWVFVPSAEASGLLITQVGNGGGSKPLVWDAFDLVKAVAGNYDQWVEVNRVVDIPEATTAATGFGIYLWRNNPSSQPIYLDDLTVTVEPPGA